LEKWVGHTWGGKQESILKSLNKGRKRRCSQVLKKKVCGKFKEEKKLMRRGGRE